MCGIAGGIGWIDPAMESAIASMGGAMSHRGPDGSGQWRSGDARAFRGAAFAFRRLAIQDLSPAGDQPMVDEETGNALVFNGEIYNFAELRAMLRRLGHRFRSTGDAEVLLVAYREWGVACLERLRGMFAFAVWDAARRKVLLARDRLGIKPLYIAPLQGTHGGVGTVVFASELRGLLASGLLPRRLCPEAIRSYLWNGFVVGPRTIVDGAWQLPPGCFAEICPRTGVIETTKWWEIPREAADPDGDKRLSAALGSAVRQHLASDAPVGILLSGGVDSSAMAAMAAGVNGGAAIDTFSLGFDEAEFDETQSAIAAARAFRTRHHAIHLSGGEFEAQLDRALSSLDQPSIDGLNTYFISAALAQRGFKVAIAGTGGDELFGGYRSFADLPRLLRLLPRSGSRRGRALLAAAGGLASLRSMGRGLPSQTRWGKALEIAQAGPDPVRLYQVAAALFTRRFLGELVDGERGFDPSEDDHGLPVAFERRVAAMTAGQSPLHAISQMELASFLGERLLRDTDAASMAASLEIRVPLLDHEVVEAACRVATRERFHPIGRKMLLRRIALSDAPAGLFERPKSGFVLPIVRWSSGRLAGRISELMLDESICSQVGIRADAARRLWLAYRSGAAGIHWSRVWAIFALLHWADRHGATLGAGSSAVESIPAWAMTPSNAERRAA